MPTRVSQSRSGQAVAPRSAQRILLAGGRVAPISCFLGRSAAKATMSCRIVGVGVFSSSVHRFIGHLCSSSSLYRRPTWSSQAARSLKRCRGLSRRTRLSRGPGRHATCPYSSYPGQGPLSDRRRNLPSGRSGCCESVRSLPNSLSLRAIIQRRTEEYAEGHRCCGTFSAISASLGA